MIEIKSYNTLRSINKNLYFGGFSLLPLVFIIGLLFIVYIVSRLLGLIYLMIPVVFLVFYFSKKYAKIQKKSKDDILDTYFITNNQPSYLEDNHHTFSLLKKKTDGTE